MRALRRGVAVVFLCAFCVQGTRGVRAVAAKHPDLSGHWTLSRDRSEFPEDIGFNAPWATTAATSASSSGRSRGGGGGRGAGGVGTTLMPSGTEGDETFKIVHDLEDEAKNPPTSFVIAETDTSLTFTTADGRARTFHTDRKEDIQDLADAPVVTRTTWDKSDLVIEFVVEKGRSAQYRYARLADGALQVQLRFVESGGDKTPTTRIYTPVAGGQ